MIISGPTNSLSSLSLFGSSHPISLWYRDNHVLRCHRLRLRHIRCRTLGTASRRLPSNERSQVLCPTNCICCRRLSALYVNAIGVFTSLKPSLSLFSNRHRSLKLFITDSKGENNSDIRVKFIPACTVYCQSKRSNRYTVLPSQVIPDKIGHRYRLIDKSALVARPPLH